MAKISSDNLFLFMYTLEEYKRFFNQLSSHSLTAEYDEASYKEINLKLMLLRKYGNKNENVYVDTIIKKAIQEYPAQKEKFEHLLENYDVIEKQQLKHILPDGTKLDLYETIEDVMYGMYLHADQNRIMRLMKTDESLRFICVRKYVEEFEKIVFRLYDLLKECGESITGTPQKERASALFLGDETKNAQEIGKSPYWKNLYGYDANEEDVKEIMESCSLEESIIQLVCSEFLEELKKENFNEIFLSSLIYPDAKKDWGDFSEAHTFYNAIPNPGMSSKVRFNEEHNMAYVRIFPHVDDCFIMDSPHILSEIYNICLIKENNNADWKILSIKGSSH